MNIDYLTRKIKESKMTLVELSEKSKVTRQTIYNVMNKDHFPSLDTVLQICKTLNLSGTELSIVLGIKEEE